MINPRSHTPDPAFPAGASGSSGLNGPGPHLTGWRTELALFWLLAGSFLVMLHLALVLLSPHLGYGAPRPAGAILALVGIEVAAGAVYLALVWRLPDLGTGRQLLPWILLVGLFLRLVMLGSTPMLESHYYRHLWDGAVTAHGFNPYQYTPEAVMTGTAVPEALSRLALESGPVITHISHPALPTISPLLSQAAFALAYWLDPWSVTALRLVFLAFDLATLGLLVLLLRALNLPLAALAIYWWNPLLVKEIINSCHMDILALPWVLGAVWFVLKAKGRTFTALAGGVGTQIWPLALLPLAARAFTARAQRLVLGLALLVLLLGLIFLPVYFGDLKALSSFWTYARGLEMNDSLFKLFHWGLGWLFQGLDLAQGAAADVTWILVGVLLAAWVIRLAYRPVVDGLDFARRSLLVLAALFFLSPVQFPWYYAWLLPFLVLQPRGSLLLLTALLPLYYLRYFFLARGQVHIFDYGIVWVEYLPVWVLLLREFWVSSRSSGQLAEEGERT
jgi:alpha-1,6-mannosyltransferase